MRVISDPQRCLSFYAFDVKSKVIWNKIDEILCACPSVLILVLRDLTTHANGTPKKNTGAPGMSADLVLRLAIIKMRLQLSYRGLYDRVDDSIVLREFCGIPFGALPSFTSIQSNLKQLRSKTMAEVNRTLVQHAVALDIEKGRDVRLDTTGVESDIHYPTDAALLWDVVRVLTRGLERCEATFPEFHGWFHDHRRVAHKLLLKIVNDKRPQTRKERHRQLINYTQKTVGYAQAVRDALLPQPGTPQMDSYLDRIALAASLDEVLPLAATVIDQAKRRVINGETVPVDEKIVSIFEPHTDILVKGRRDVVFGHKVLIATGRSNLILDCIILDGNPADAEQLVVPVQRVGEILGAVPSRVATDAGFASKSNAEALQAMGVTAVAFSAPKGSKIVEAIKDTRLYKQLCKWRGGIEGIISAAKRAYGLDRCNWSGLESFKVYVQCAVLAFNLQQMVRHLLA
jgi:transposase, IS5 family